jgi:hypothetical protein
MTITSASRAPGRPCSICARSSSDRESIDLAILDGSTFASIASAFPPVGRNALARHARAHLSPQQKLDMATSELFVTALTVQRVADIAARAREIASDALGRGHATTALKAGDAELRALLVLHAGGIKTEDVIDELDTLRGVATAAVAAARRNPELALLIAEEADQFGLRGEFADLVPSLQTQRKELAS